ncbi:hypothetical protein ACTFIR_009769 [Dictyostelium discoideum]
MSTTVNNNDASSSSTSASNNAESFDLRMKSMEDQINNLSLAFTRFMKEPMFSSNTNSRSQRTHDDSDTENEQSEALISFSGDIHIVAHRHQYFWEKDQDVEQTKKQIYYSTDDHKRHVEEIVVRFIFILSYGTKVDYNLLGVTFHPDIVVLLCKLRSSSSRSLETVWTFLIHSGSVYRHNAEYILRGNNFKISRDIGSQYFHFIQRLSQCLHGFGINVG